MKPDEFNKLSSKDKLHRKLVLFEVAVDDPNAGKSKVDRPSQPDDPIADCVGNESIFIRKPAAGHDKFDCIGFTTSGSYGFATGKSVQMGYVPLKVQWAYENGMD